jgi:hypothetical protein
VNQLPHDPTAATAETAETKDLEPADDPEAAEGTTDLEGPDQAGELDGPEAARGPHLPDHWPVLAFVVLGAAFAWFSYRQAGESGTRVWTLETVFFFLMNVIPSVSAILLPGALLLRHPDATHRARMLLFGTLLFAAVPFLRFIEGSLQVVFQALTPAPAELGYVPMALLYNVLQALVVLFAVLYLVLGLIQARHWAYSRAARAAGLVILFVALAAAGAMLYSTSQTDLSGIAMDPMLWLYFGLSTVLGLLTILTWAYLAMNLTRGAMSGEEPVAGWFVAAIGACLVVATFAIGAWSGVVRTTDASIQTMIFWTHGILYSLGYLGLLAGFALGLPSLDPVEWDDEDAAAAGSRTDGEDGAEDDDADDEDADDEEESAA